MLCVLCITVCNAAKWPVGAGRKARVCYEI